MSPTENVQVHSSSTGADSSLSDSSRPGSPGSRPPGSGRPLARYPAALPGASEHLARTLDTSRALADAAEAGLFAAAADRVQLARDLDSLDRLLCEGIEALEALDVERLSSAIEGARAAVDALRPVVLAARGGIATCRECDQLGKVIGIEHGGSLRWEWKGRNVKGELVHPWYIVQLRPLGDAVPWRCPDHEQAARLEAIGRGELPPRTMPRRVELERRRAS